MCVGGREGENRSLWLAIYTEGNASKTITVTHLWYALQRTIETPIAMMLRVIDSSVGHLRHGRQQYAHRSVREMRGKSELVGEKLVT